MRIALLLSLALLAPLAAAQDEERIPVPEGKELGRPRRRHLPAHEPVRGPGGDGGGAAVDRPHMR